jgi:hypothetical protein
MPGLQGKSRAVPIAANSAAVRREREAARERTGTAMSWSGDLTNQRGLLDPAYLMLIFD